MKLPEFFKVYFQEDSSDELEIPRTFVSKTEGMKPGSVLLRGPSGNTWEVELIKKESLYFFGQGWSTFVKDHLIREAEFFVFRYDGDSLFAVKILDHSGCEKVSAFSAECSQREKRAITEEMVTTPDEMINILSRRIRSFRTESRLPGTSDNDVVVVNNDSDDIGDEDEDQDVDNDGGLQIERLDGSELFTSEHPFFKQKIKHYHLHRSLIMQIPLSFISKYHLGFSGKEKMVLWNINGDSWPVTVNTTHLSSNICGGWIGFARDNNLRIGDTCIFELVRRSDLIVHIFPSATNKRSTSKMVAAAHMNKHCSMSARANSENLNATHGNGALEPDEPNATMSFTSAYPFFSVRMKKHNITVVSIIASFVRENKLEYRKKEKMVLVNKEGKSWQVNIIQTCTVYNLCGGWAKFVSENNIEVGDTVVFELIGRLEMRVNVFPR